VGDREKDVEQSCSFYKGRSLVCREKKNLQNGKKVGKGEGCILKTGKFIRSFGDCNETNGRKKSPTRQGTLAEGTTKGVGGRGNRRNRLERERQQENESI